MSTDFPQRYVNKFKAIIEKDPEFSIGIAVIRILSEVIMQSTSTTFMGIDQEMLQVTSAIQKEVQNLPLHFQGAAKVFRAILSKTCEDCVTKWKTAFAANSARQLADAERALTLIPQAARKFLQHGMTVMTFGYDPIVFSCLDAAAQSGCRFNIVVAQGYPKNAGITHANKLTNASHNLKVTLIPDSSIGLCMNQADIVLIGTDVVLEDGGLLAPVGTYVMAALASLHKKPVYCICESFKFMRKYILSSSDIQKIQRQQEYKPENVESAIECSACEFDHTPPTYITLLITEKGPMPPAAVTHELTQLLGVS
jgi:translation initiation factor eIF-2B subunit alpha